ncbi:hypothetical protein ACFQY8_04330 [Alloscardovia venturai]|uniref:Uncharacterized protein n=2 Tax=Alloscardovia venturai TaxID=1769421 RepID=A0ABW2YA34_9BIFI
MVPAWVWALLWIFFFVCLGYGVYFVIRHGLSAGRKVGKTGSVISERVTRLSDTNLPETPEDSVPFFIRPLWEVSDRYTTVRTEIEERKTQRKHKRALIRQRWDSYTLTDLETLENSLETSASISDSRAQDVQ